MARPLRVEYRGAFYHVTARGNERAPIFRDDVDCGSLLAGLAKVVRRYEWRCHSFCLMGNHYHTLIETPRANLSIGMRQLNGVYAARFNRRHNRVGHLFQGRFKSVLIEKERHAVELARYIALNPVRAGLCRNPREWRWSSYRALAGLEPAPVFLTVDWLLDQLSPNRVLAAQRFRDFADELIASNPLDGVLGEIYLADASFVEMTHPAPPFSREIPQTQREPLRPALDSLFATGSDAEIETAVHLYGYRLSQVAQYLRVHPSTITRRLQAQENRREE